MKTTALFYSCLLFFALNIQAQEPVTALRPEKTIFQAQLLRFEFKDLSSLLGVVATHFGADPKKQVAILANGVYVSRVKCTGNYAEKSHITALKDIELYDIERVDLKYAPHYTVPDIKENFIGTMNLVFPSKAEILDESDEIAYDPLVERLKILKELEVAKPRVTASVITRFGVVFGVASKHDASFFGIPVEVPISEKLSLQSELLVVLAQPRLSSFNDPVFDTINTTRYQALEGRFLLKYYLNRKYIQLYGFAGPFVEKGRLSYRVANQIDTVEKRGNFVLGATVGVGLQLKRGLFIQVGGSIPFYGNGLGFIENDIAAKLSIGFRFGGP